MPFAWGWPIFRPVIFYSDLPWRAQPHCQHAQRYLASLARSEAADLGAKLVFAFGPDFRGAIRSYYARLVEAGIVQVPRRSPRKEAAMAAPQFNTWAEQVATDTRGGT